MFELLGLAIATGLLLALAGATAAIIAVPVWIILRRRACRKRLTLIAVMLPFVTAAYWWSLTAVFPGTSLFADIDQPLPNGFALKALGKMPEFGNVEVSSGDTHARVPDPWIDRVALNGDILYGHFNTRTTEAVQEPYFIFDTRHDTVTTFVDLASLETRLGYHPTMVSLPEFLSPVGKIYRTWYLRAGVIPPLLAFTILFGLVLRARLYSPT